MKITVSLMALAAAGMLAACGGGDSMDSGSTPEQIRILTGAEPAAETYGDRVAREAAIIERADSLIASTVYGEERSSGDSFRIRASCSGTACTLTEAVTGYHNILRLSDLEHVSPGNAESIGTKHGITLWRSAGMHQGVNTHFLAAGMEHSAFQLERSWDTEFDARMGMAVGDLTGTQPSGSATWRGVMVGTPATGAGRGDRLQGDAELTYDMVSRSLDTAFTGIKNIDRLRAHTTAAVRFNAIPVDARGKFQAGLTGNRIQGGFYGPGHAEAAGVFEQANIVGAFGAKR